MKFIRNYSRRHTAGLLSALALLLVLPLLAQTLTRYQAQPGSKMKLEGDSTLHKWTVESSVVGGYMELDPSLISEPQNAKPGKIKAQAYVSVPVRQLKSGKKSMDDVMHDALKVQQNPKIEYRLTELALQETPKSNEAPLKCDSKGELTVAGVTNQIVMPITITRVEQNKLKASGSVPLKMSSFGIKRPGLLGMTATDDVKVSFDWLTAPPEKSAEAK
jgi:polyisoprenoid-binding protein YceI